MSYVAFIKGVGFYMKVRPLHYFVPVMHFITLDPRLPFPDSVGGIFPCPATIRVFNGFPSWRGYNDWQFWAYWLGG